MQESSRSGEDGLIGHSGLSEHAIDPTTPALLLGYGRIGEAAIGAGIEELARSPASPPVSWWAEIQARLGRS